MFSHLHDDSISFFLNQNDQTWTDIVCTCHVIWQSQKCFLLYALTPTPGRLPHKDNILRLTQNGRNFTNGIFKSMFLYAKCCVFIQISPKRPIDFTRVLVHVMALPLTENTPFSWWFILLMHIDVFTCVTRPKRVIISCLAQRTTVNNLIISGARQFSNTTCEMTNVSMNLINILCYFSNACRSDADTTWWNYPFNPWGSSSKRWLSARLHYLQCVNNWDIPVWNSTIDTTS